MELYTGKQGNTTEVGLGGNVVTRLTRALVGQHFAVYMDKIFTSIALFQKLLEDKIYATGTLHSNRKGFPQDLLDKVKRGLLSRGDTVSGQSGNLVATVWQDTKLVTILSSQHNPSDITTVQRKKSDRTSISVKCPQAIGDYNAYMGGVDLGDQYRGYYRVLQILCIMSKR